MDKQLLQQALQEIKELKALIIDIKQTLDKQSKVHIIEKPVLSSL